MPYRYMVVAVNEFANTRSIVDHFATRLEAEKAMADENFLIDEGTYGDEGDGIVLHIEEIEIPEMGEL